MGSRPPAPDTAETVFSGRMLRLTRERWSEAEREIVERADSVAIVAVDPGRNIVLVRQFREAARRDLVELPAGTIDRGEEPLATAKRELAEETGLGGGRWRAGPSFFTTPGFCRERVHLFIAEDIEPAPAGDGGGEEVTVLRWPVAEVAERLTELEDGKTIAGLLLYLRERR